MLPAGSGAQHRLASWVHMADHLPRQAGRRAGAQVQAGIQAGAQAQAGRRAGGQAQGAGFWAWGAGLLGRVAWSAPGACAQVLASRCTRAVRAVCGKGAALRRLGWHEVRKGWAGCQAG